MKMKLNMIDAENLKLFMEYVKSQEVQNENFCYEAFMLLSFKLHKEGCSRSQLDQLLDTAFKRMDEEEQKEKDQIFH